MEAKANSGNRISWAEMDFLFSRGRKIFIKASVTQPGGVEGLKFPQLTKNRSNSLLLEWMWGAEMEGPILSWLGREEVYKWYIKYGISFLNTKTYIVQRIQRVNESQLNLLWLVIFIFALKMHYWAANMLYFGERISLTGFR